MIITACGEGCFKVQTGGVTLMTEPFGGDISARFKPDIILKHRYDLTPFGTRSMRPAGQPFVVEGPGEYEIKGVEVFGFPHGVYLVKAEEMKLGFIGAGMPADSDAIKLVEELEGVDILFIPATDAGEKIIKQLEPKIVVPASANPTALLKTFNQKPVPQEKLTIKKKEIPATGMQIVILSL